MTAKLRVTLSPLPRPSGGQKSVLDGVAVSLTRFGPEATLVQLEAPAAAQLVFHAATFDKVRGQAAPSFTRFASIAGTLELKGDPPKPRFVGDGQPITYDAPPNDDLERLLRRKLRLEFEEASFEGMLDEENTNELLVLPAEPPEARFMEVDTELLVDGTAEAALGDSALLDIFLTVHTALVRLYDGNGRTLPNTRFAASVEGEVVTEGTSDDEGVAIITGLRGTDVCELRWGINATGPLHFRRDLVVDPRKSTTRTHLRNLGFDDTDDERGQIGNVQTEFGIAESGPAKDVATFLRNWHDAGKIELPAVPERDAADDPDFTDSDLEGDLF